MKDGEWDSNDAGHGRSGTLVTDEYDRRITPPSIAVIEAIASVEDVDPIDVSSANGMTLHDHVDTDALDRLLAAGSGTAVSITFPVTEYRVWIESDEITIVDRDNDSTAPPDPDQ